MENSPEIIKNRKEWIYILFAILLALFIPIIMTSVTYMTYTTTDDSYLMQVIAGYFNDRPMEWVPFLSPILTKFIALLYKIFPNEYCYVYLQLIILTISVSIINYSIFRKIKNIECKHIFIYGLIICFLFDVILCWTFVRMHFYYVSVIAGTAALSIVLTANFTKKQHYIIHLLSVLFMFFICICWSIDVGYVLICFISLGAIYRAIKPKTIDKKFLLFACILIFSCLLFVFASTYILKSERNKYSGKEYSEWNAYRVSYWDYPTPSYNDNIALYNSINWSEDFFKLTQKMYFMDKKFSINELSKIVDQYNMIGSTSDNRTFQDALHTGKQLILNNKAALGMFILMCCITLSSIFFLTKEKQQIIKIFFSLCCFFISGALCFHLAYRNRFPLRAFVPIAIPCVTFLLFNYMEIFSEYNMHLVKKNSNYTLQHNKFIINIISILIIVVSYYAYSINIYNYLTDYTTEKYYITEKEKEHIIYDYVSNNKSNIYVYDWTILGTYDPFPELKIGSLSNLFCWGGARLYTYPYNEQLKLNGLNTLFSEDFICDNVYFISNSETNIELLYKYLSNEYDVESYQIIEELEYGFKIINFSN
ncbi:MAG: hypothetical protein IJV15_10440 [Lachnospiraceae bacterium]|nr:hypothetical protein [Lachnospiraceae bacterium]